MVSMISQSVFEPCIIAKSERVTMTYIYIYSNKNNIFLIAELKNSVSVVSFSFEQYYLKFRSNWFFNND